MDTVLVMVTLMSLGMATTMSLVAWKLIRDERQRASARITALAADAEQPRDRWRDAERSREAKRHVAAAASVAAVAAEARADANRPAGRAQSWPPAPPPQNRPAADPPPAATAHNDRPRRAPAAHHVDVYIHASAESHGDRARAVMASDAKPSPDGFVASNGAAPRHDMFSSTAGSSQGRRGVPFAAVMGVLAVLLLGGAVLAVNHGIGSVAASSQATEPTSAPLELVSLHHLREGDRLSVDGRVRNPTSGSPLKQVNAVVFLFDHGGTYISTGRAPIEFTTLEPGQESRFTVALPNATAVGRYRVSFRADSGGVVPHIDRRATSPLAAISNVAAP